MHFLHFFDVIEDLGRGSFQLDFSVGNDEDTVGLSRLLHKMSDPEDGDALGLIQHPDRLEHFLSA